MAEYGPIVTSVRMSDYGYWVVEVSMQPGKVLAIMVSVTGITPDAAATLALSGLAGLPQVRRHE